MEERVVIESSGLRLEGLMTGRGAAAGVVISHPHPLYGGDMVNPVVECIARAYGRQGFATLRFNFRGVGRSQGGYDEGRGEQSDVRSALDFLAHSGVDALYLAGYSFGAWVNALAVQPASSVARMVMVSPPVALLPFAESLGLPCLELVVTGSEDEVAPPRLIRQKMAQWNKAAALAVVPRADHFFSGALNELEAIFSRHLGRQRAAPR